MMTQLDPCLHSGGSMVAKLEVTEDASAPVCCGVHEAHSYAI